MRELDFLGVWRAQHRFVLMLSTFTNPKTKFTQILEDRMRFFHTQLQSPTCSTAALT